jgi:hypothetical protein
MHACHLIVARQRSCKTLPRQVIFYPHFYLQTVQMQVHLANGVMGGEAGRITPFAKCTCICTACK